MNNSKKSPKSLKIFLAFSLTQYNLKNLLRSLITDFLSQKFFIKFSSLKHLTREILKITNKTVKKLNIKNHQTKEKYTKFTLIKWMRSSHQYATKNITIFISPSLHIIEANKRNLLFFPFLLYISKWMEINEKIKKIISLTFQLFFYFLCVFLFLLKIHFISLTRCLSQTHSLWEYK